MADLKRHLGEVRTSSFAFRVIGVTMLVDKVNGAARPLPIAECEELLVGGPLIEPS
jgi:hypothetical protein